MCSKSGSPDQLKTRFTIWGALSGLACGVCLSVSALPFLPVLQAETGTLIATVLVSGTLGAFVGFSLALMKDGNGGA